jgi:hypothetical protein
MLLFPRPFPRAVAFCNASPEFVAHLEECHGLSRGTDIQIYRPFRFTWKQYLKMLGSEQRGKYCVRAKFEIETIGHAISDKLGIYPYRDSSVFV